MIVCMISLGVSKPLVSLSLLKLIEIEWLIVYGFWHFGG